MIVNISEERYYLGYAGEFLEKVSYPTYALIDSYMLCDA